MNKVVIGPEFMIETNFKCVLDFLQSKEKDKYYDRFNKNHN